MTNTATIHQNMFAIKERLRNEFQNGIVLLPKEYLLLLNILQVKFLKLENLKKNNNTNKKNNNTNKKNNNTNKKNELLRQMNEILLLLHGILDMNRAWMYIVITKGTTVKNLRPFLDKEIKELSNDNKKSYTKNKPELNSQVVNLSRKLREHSSN